MQSTTKNNNEGRDNETNQGDLLEIGEQFNIFGGNESDNHVGGDGGNASVMTGFSQLSPGGLAAADSSPSHLQRPSDQTFLAGSCPTAQLLIMQE